MQVSSNIRNLKKIVSEIQRELLLELKSCSRYVNVFVLKIRKQLFPELGVSSCLNF